MHSWRQRSFRSIVCCRATPIWGSLLFILEGRDIFVFVVFIILTTFSCLSSILTGVVVVIFLRAGLCYGIEKAVLDRWPFSGSAPGKNFGQYRRKLALRHQLIIFPA